MAACVLIKEKTPPPKKNGHLNKNRLHKQFGKLFSANYLLTLGKKATCQTVLGLFVQIVHSLHDAFVDSPGQHLRIFPCR